MDQSYALVPLVLGSYRSEKLRLLLEVSTYLPWMETRFRGFRRQHAVLAFR